jgi:hypothetical protein
MYVSVPDYSGNSIKEPGTKILCGGAVLHAGNRLTRVSIIEINPSVAKQMS